MRSLIFGHCRDGCNMRRFSSFNHIKFETVLNLLEAIYLTFYIGRYRITVVKFLWTIEAADERRLGLCTIQMRDKAVSLLHDWW